MTDDTTPTDDTSEHRRKVDIRTEADEQADEDFDSLLEAYKELEDIDSDDPADEKLRELAAQMNDNDTPSDSDSAADSTVPDTEFNPDDDPAPAGETTVTLSDDGGPVDTSDVTADDAEEAEPDLQFGEQIDRDDADFVDETPDDVQVADDETKAKRRAELEAEGMLPDDAADDGSEGEAASQTAQQSNEQRYGVDISADSDAEPDTGEPLLDADDTEPEVSDPSVSEEEAADIDFNADVEDADFEDVLEDGLFADVSDEIDPEDFDFEAQEVEDASERKDDKIIEINGVYFYLSQPEGDRFYNMIEAAQQAQSVEDRHYLLIDTVVERPMNASKRVEEWAGATRAQLATECAIHSGLSEMQDFQ